MNAETTNWLQIDRSSTAVTIKPRGDWRLQNLNSIPAPTLPVLEPGTEICIDGSELDSIDTAGAMQLLHEVMRGGYPIRHANMQGAHRNIIEIVTARFRADEPTRHEPRLGVVEHAGKAAVDAARATTSLINFIGQSASAFAEALRRPRLFRVKELFVQLETACVDAIPIVALVTFLIGLVIAYLYASQMERFGANVFIVDAVSIAMCRELSPLITAVILAGRSGSAFTAHIGTMKLNEEVDALLTLGLSPMQVLVLPRILALILAMPLLVFVGDVVGTAAGMLIAHSYLDITVPTFLERLQAIFKLKTLIVGLVKAPVFAAFIAMIGCKMGLTVENNARSVGLHTTSTVVQSVVAVILLNAAFAIVCVELRI